ncbi:MAG: serine/threonine-protein kinase [Syntrophobacterales bacterium]|jgi:CHASE2 domain-containing sensor protein/tRNA A-37 threonylcarbamoyl transferase component Bud32
MMSYRKAIIISIAAFFIFVFAHLGTVVPLESTHLKIRDFFFRSRGPAPPNPQVTIVAIDDSSIAHYGRWPWPRVYIATLVHRLAVAGVRTIGIDISFLPSATQSVPVSLGPEFKPFLQWLGLNPRSTASYTNDQLLAMAIRKAGNVVLPFYFEFKGHDSKTTHPLPNFLSSSAYLLFDDVSKLSLLPLLHGSELFAPPQSLGQASAGLGCVNAILARDGVLRSDPAIVAYGDHYFPSLGIQLVRLHLGLSWAEVKVNAGEGIQIGKHQVPIDDRGFVDLNYYGGRETFPHISYKKVMEGDLKSDTLQDKLVLVGITAAGVHDLWLTPFGPGYPGVEKHASAVANILDGRFVVRPHFSSFVEISFMLLVALAIGTAAGSRSTWILWVLSAILLFLTLAGSYWLLSAHNFWLQPFFPSLLIILLAAVFQIVRLRLVPIRAEIAVEPTVEAVQTIAAESSDLTDDELDIIGRYQIEGELGHGAMGVVYKAVDPTIGRHVAIKTIRLDQSLGAKQLEDLRERFLREAQVAGQLSHPSIVTIYDVVEKAGNLFIAMEYIEGQELSRFCGKEIPLKPRQVVTIIAQLCDALHYAHKEGIVHRDIKPSNVMLLKDGRPKIMDFGITKMISADTTQTAAIMGTPSYMSPEQVDLEKVDGRSDLFSVGAMFYELLCGQRPFTGPNITAILKKITTEDPPPLSSINPQIHPKLEAVVSRLMAKSPGDRFQSGGDVVSVLKSLLEDPSIWE